MSPTLSGRLVRYWRTRRGMTTTELARKVGVSRPAVEQWESGATSPRAGRVERIAESLGLTVQGFYGGASALDADPRDIPPPAA